MADVTILHVMTTLSPNVVVSLQVVCY